MGSGPAALYKMAKCDPVGEAVREGYLQEKSDLIFSPHSASSYEDLPSDKFGADFGANYFDPNNELTFGEQLLDYFKEVLNAVEPEQAPNFDILPQDDTMEKPIRINKKLFLYTDKNP